MADTAAGPAPPKKKKLPFKPTAIGRTAPRPSPAAQGKEDEDDLALFRRSREMAPIVAADRERMLRKKQKQKEAGRQRSSTGEKHSLDGSEEPALRTHEVPELQPDGGLEGLQAPDDSMTAAENSYRFVTLGCPTN